jgi:hypothetical protein
MRSPPTPASSGVQKQVLLYYSTTTDLYQFEKALARCIHQRQMLRLTPYGVLCLQLLASCRLSA